MKYLLWGDSRGWGSCGGTGDLEPGRSSPPDPVHAGNLLLHLQPESLTMYTTVCIALLSLGLEASLSLHPCRGSTCSQPDRVSMR